MLHGHRRLLVGGRVGAHNVGSGIALLHFLQGLVEDGGLVRLELPGADALGEQLVDLLEGAALELGDEEEEEEEAAKVGAGPDVAVLGALEVRVVSRVKGVNLQDTGTGDLPSSGWWG